jgi:hypothetical protein
MTNFITILFKKKRRRLRERERERDRETETEETEREKKIGTHSDSLRERKNEGKKRQKKV